MPTPKVACSTIKMALIKMELNEPNMNTTFTMHNLTRSPFLTLKQVGNLNKFLKRKDIFRFTFVRNPYSRLLSAYLDKVVKNMPPKQNILKHYGKNWKEHRDFFVSFDDFVDIICDMKVEEMDQHWRNQYYQTFSHTINYDFIGYFERLNSDLEILNRNFRGRLLHNMKSVQVHRTSSSEKLNKYYTKSIQEKVYNKYEKDFEVFGYDSDINNQYPLID